jgi:hypothetical protein
MHNIQDKDLDKLFKDKLADSEMEPPALLWANIEQQIQPKRKRVMPVYWIAAACAFFALTTWLLFDNENKIQLHGNPEVVTTDQKPLQTPKESPESPANGPFVAHVEKATDVLKVKKTVKNEDPEKDLIAMQPSTPKVHLNHTTAGKKEALKVSEMQMEIVPIPPAEVSFAQIYPEQPVTEEATRVNESSEAINVGSERNEIANIGDLVNFVVGKVDKREKKFLQFKSDDDNSSLIAINIGIIKLNPKNKSRR